MGNQAGRSHECSARDVLPCDPDVLAFDAASSVLYVAGERGVVSMFRVTAGGVEKTGEGMVGANAHVVAVDPATHRSYFPLKDIGRRPVLRIMAPLSKE